MQECVHMYWSMERNTFEARAALPGMIRGVIVKLLHMCDVIRKWSIILACIFLLIQVIRQSSFYTCPYL